MHFIGDHMYLYSLAQLISVLMIILAASDSCVIVGPPIDDDGSDDLPLTIETQKNIDARYKTL